LVRVKVEVFGTLRDKLGWKERILDLRPESDGVTLAEVLNALPDLKQYVVRDGGIAEGFLVFINGIHAQFRGGLKARVRDGDEVAVFPPGAGG